MSAFISVAGTSSLAMITDGAAYNDKGIVVALGRKVTVGRVAPIAVTTRGSHAIGRHHQRQFCEAADKYGVDIALDSFEAALPEMEPDPKRKGLDYMHWHILAFSETRGLVRLSAHNMPFAFGDGEKPMDLQPVSGVYAAGNKIDMAALAAVGVSPIRPGEDQPAYIVREGANIMEAMRLKRSRPLPDETHQGQYIIGGQCDLTIVTERGAAVQTLRTWPDRVGSLIDPFADLTSMNRQQRRALEREARKRATV